MEMDEAKDGSPFYYGRKWKKTQTKSPSNDSLSHKRGSEQSERASEWVSVAEGASKASSPEQANEWAVRVNGRVSGPVLQSLFLAVLDHSAFTNMIYIVISIISRGEGLITRWESTNIYLHL